MTNESMPHFGLLASAEPKKESPDGTWPTALQEQVHGHNVGKCRLSPMDEPNHEKKITELASLLGEEGQTKLTS